MTPSLNLPNYFLADLPCDAEITDSMISESCSALKRNREQHLTTRSTQSLIGLLSGVAKNWLEAEYPFRKLAVERGPEATGFSHQTIGRGLVCFFSQLTPASFQALIEQEFGHARRLDDLVSTPAEENGKRAAMAVGPELIAHFTDGQAPDPTLLNIASAMLVRSAQFGTCSSGTSF